MKVAAAIKSLLCIFFCGGIVPQVQPVPVEGDLRLEGGSDSNSGRLEIFINGTWGTVCGNMWNQADTNVVCRQLNFPSTRALFRIESDPGMEPAVLDNFECTGSETRLTNCNATESVDGRYCSRIGVGCHNDSMMVGNVRLVGGRSEFEGRVEIFIDGVWGTVCDDGWDITNAAVVCRQLGFNSSVPVFAGTNFGRGSGQIWLDDVRCDGTEDSLVLCNHRPVGSHNCAHREDVSVLCLPPVEGIPQGAVRLVGGRREYEGQVEVFWAGAWGTVCDDNWDDLDAAVVCRQLNFTTSRAQATVTAHYGAGSGRILLDEVRCNGEEQELLECPNDGIFNHNCVRSEDAGVICPPIEPMVCSPGDVRLTNGTTPSEGRVEICVDSRWSTACGSLFTAREARVICRQLMMPYTNATVLQRAYFGKGTSFLTLGTVNCHGRETTITACTYYEEPLCGHEEDVSVRCLEAGELIAEVGEIRLVGGRGILDGRVEIFSDYNSWGTVCDDDWDARDAEVVCRQLGYPTEGAVALHHAHYGSGNDSQFILLDDVHCTGEETRLVDCSHRGENIHNCLHLEDASVRCAPPPTPGQAVNVEVTPSLENCSTVSISWDAPIDYEYPNLITHYSVFITTSESEGPTFTDTTNTSNIVMSDLPCGSNMVCFIVTFAVQAGPGEMSNATTFTTSTANALQQIMQETEVADMEDTTTQRDLTEHISSQKFTSLAWVLAIPTLIVVVIVAIIFLAGLVLCRRSHKSSSHDVEDSGRIQMATNRFTIIDRAEDSVANTGEQPVRNPAVRINEVQIIT